MPELTPTENHTYVVIMAGGSGTRLWPLSRKTTPKQFRSFTPHGKRTLLEETWDRVSKSLPSTHHIFISTTEAYRPMVLSILPSLSEDRVIVEPEARGTAAAVALAAEHIRRIDPEALVATIASDHIIANDDEFSRSLVVAFETVSKFPERLVILGINPTAPDTSFGYIKIGKEIDTIGSRRIFSVDSFKEKPDRKTAEEYLRQWEYLWNAGYFIFSAKTLRSMLERYTPEIPMAIDMLIDSSDANLYSTLSSEPFDTAIIERLEPHERTVIPAPLEWSDVGNWSALFDLLEKQQETSIVARGEHVDVGSEKCLILSNTKLIATIGLRDVIIIETDDCILVADKSHASEIKRLLEKVRTEKGEHYL